MNYVPAWKDREGNRLLMLAENHLFDTEHEARQFQLADFLFYVPFGWSPSGVIALDLTDGAGAFTHVECDGPLQSKVAVFEGPIFEAFYSPSPAGAEPAPA